MWNINMLNHPTVQPLLTLTRGLCQWANGIRFIYPVLAGDQSASPELAV